MSWEFTRKNAVRLPWLLRFVQIGTCGLGFVMAWRELNLGVWTEPRQLASFVQSSLLARLDPAFEGTLPLIEIIGGFACLGQLFAPVLVWRKTVRPFLGVGLLILNSLLQIVTPVSGLRWILIAGLFTLLPEAWLTIDREAWSGEASARKRTLRGISLFFITATMVVTIFERNIVQQFTLMQKIDNPQIEKAYRSLAQPFIGVGNLILFNSIWKMYSPVWRHAVWIEWYATKKDGSVVNWPQQNFSPDYRLRRRTWTEALFTDFKKEKVFVGMLSGDREKAAYGHYLCRQIEAQTGERPVSVRPEINSFDIRAPESEWSIDRQVSEHKDVRAEVPCD